MIDDRARPRGRRGTEEASDATDERQRSRVAGQGRSSSSLAARVTGVMAPSEDRSTTTPVRASNRAPTIVETERADRDRQQEERRNRSCRQEGNTEQQSEKRQRTKLDVRDTAQVPGQPEEATEQLGEMRIGDRVFIQGRFGAGKRESRWAVVLNISNKWCDIFNDTEGFGRRTQKVLLPVAPNNTKAPDLVRGSEAFEHIDYDIFCDGVSNRCDELGLADEDLNHTSKEAQTARDNEERLRRRQALSEARSRDSKPEVEIVKPVDEAPVQRAVQEGLTAEGARVTQVAVGATRDNLARGHPAAQVLLHSALDLDGERSSPAQSTPTRSTEAAKASTQRVGTLPRIVNATVDTQEPGVSASVESARATSATDRDSNLGNQELLSLSDIPAGRGSGSQASTRSASQPGRQTKPEREQHGIVGF